MSKGPPLKSRMVSAASSSVARSNSASSRPASAMASKVASRVAAVDGAVGGTSGAEARVRAAVSVGSSADLRVPSSVAGSELVGWWVAGTSGVELSATTASAIVVSAIVVASLVVGSDTAGPMSVFGQSLARGRTISAVVKTIGDPGKMGDTVGDGVDEGGVGVVGVLPALLGSTTLTGCSAGGAVRPGRTPAPGFARLG